MEKGDTSDIEDDFVVIDHNEYDTQVIVNNEHDFDVIYYCEEEYVDLSGRKKDDVDLSGRRKDDVDESGRRKDDVDVSGRRKDDVDVSGRRKDDVDVSGRRKDDVDVSSRRKDDVDVSCPKKDDIEEINDSTGSDIEVISESEEDVEKMTNFHKCQKTDFISVSKLFGSLSKAFFSSIPSFNRLIKFIKTINDPVSSQLSDVLLLIIKRMGAMQKNLSDIDTELQRLDNAVDSDKEGTQSLGCPAKRVDQMIEGFKDDMVEILCQQSDLLRECNRILQAHKFE